MAARCLWYSESKACFYFSNNFFNVNLYLQHHSWTHYHLKTQVQILLQYYFSLSKALYFNICSLNLKVNSQVTITLALVKGDFGLYPKFNRCILNDLSLLEAVKVRYSCLCHHLPFSINLNKRLQGYGVYVSQFID